MRPARFVSARRGQVKTADRLPVRERGEFGDVAVRADSICVHSDTPNAVEVARAVRDALMSLRNH